MSERGHNELRVTLPHLSPTVPQPLNVSYLDEGDGLPLLMLHGFLGSSTAWQPLITELAHQFRCISIDLLGFGNSAKPLIQYDVALEVAFLRAIIEALGLKRYAILGHSFGGWVATAYTLNYGSDVSHLLLAAAAGIRDDEFCGRYDHLRPLLWPSPIVDWGLWVFQKLNQRWRETPGLNQLIWIRQQLQSEPAARSFLIDRMRPEAAIDTVDPVLDQIQAPTLVIIGDRDETIPLWHAQTYATQIANAQLVVLPDAGHDLLQTHSSALAQQVQQFCLTPVSQTKKSPDEQG
jgi:pimeloyl-ACP methyl ester carboxylesterase